MSGGVLTALSFLGNGVAALATFVVFPKTYAWSWIWLSTHVLGGYGSTVQEWAPWIWSALLIWVLFAVIRAAFFLTLSLGGILAIVRMFFRNREDD